MISGTLASSSSGADFWVGDVGDDELGQPCEQPHGLGEVLRLRLVEVEDDRQVGALAEFLPQPLQNCDPAFSEPAEQKHPFSADRVHDFANFGVVQESRAAGESPVPVQRSLQPRRKCVERQK